MNRQYIKIFSINGYSADDLNIYLGLFVHGNNIKIISNEMIVHDNKCNDMKEYILTIVYEIF